MAKKTREDSLDVSDLAVPKDEETEVEEVLDAPAIPEPTKEPELKGKMGLEREIRRYVRHKGGFRKGLSDPQIRKARTLLDKAGRKEVKWDESIIVPGIDKPTVAGMTIV